MVINDEKNDGKSYQTKKVNRSLPMILLLICDLV